MGSQPLLAGGWSSGTKQLGASQWVSVPPSGRGKAGFLPLQIFWFRLMDQEKIWHCCKAPCICGFGLRTQINHVFFYFFSTLFSFSVSSSSSFRLALPQSVAVAKRKVATKTNPRPACKFLINITAHDDHDDYHGQKKSCHQNPRPACKFPINMRPIL